MSHTDTTTQRVVGDAKIVSSIKMPVVEITPEIAQKWLERNSRNRNLRAAKVDTYAAIMSRGEWRPDREPIEFDDTGALLNGQHRLNAVVKSGTTITNPVRGGVPREDMVVMDTGLSRQASDVLSMDGYENVTVLAAAAKALYLWRQAPGMTMLRAGSSKISNEIIHEFVRANPDLLNSVKFIVHHTRQFKLVPPSAMVAIHYEIKRIHGVEVANEFFIKMAEGYGLEEGSPIVALRNVLLKSATAFTKPPTELRMAWTIHAFNKWLKGDSDVRLIRHGKNMEFPTIHV